MSDNNIISIGPFSFAEANYNELSLYIISISVVLGLLIFYYNNSNQNKAKNTIISNEAEEITSTTTVIESTVSELETADNNISLPNVTINQVDVSSKIVKVTFDDNKENIISTSHNEIKTTNELVQEENISSTNDNNNTISNNFATPVKRGRKKKEAEITGLFMSPDGRRLSSRLNAKGVKNFNDFK